MPDTVDQVTPEGNMPVRPRPILAVRLIGPTEIVTVHKARLVAHRAAAQDVADHLGDLRPLVATSRLGYGRHDLDIAFGLLRALGPTQRVLRRWPLSSVD